MTEQNKTPLTAQPGSAPAPEQKPTEKRPAEKPLRRVGSLTLGACLIAAGVFFLLYFFVPGFDVQLTLKIAPAVALVLLGCEVLFFAARPGRWKYDFVSVLVCLVLMAGCFCMAMLPMLWDELSGENQQTMNRMGMRMMGAMLISSLIIFPALTAMRLFRSFRGVILSAAVTSVVCFCAGLTISFVYSTPVGATVVAANLALFLAACVLRLLRR